MTETCRHGHTSDAGCRICGPRDWRDDYDDAVARFVLRVEPTKPLVTDEPQPGESLARLHDEEV